MTAVAPQDDPSLPPQPAASLAHLRSQQASRASLRNRRQSTASSQQPQPPPRPQSANREKLQARRDEERNFRCQFFAAIGLAVLGGFLCVAGVALIVYGVPTPERIKRDYGQLSAEAQLQMQVRLMLYGRIGGLLLGAGVFFVIILLVIGLDYKMHLDRQKPVSESATAEMNRRLYANIIQTMRRSGEDGDSTSLSTSHRSSDRRSSMAVALVTNGSLGGSSAILRVSTTRPSTASGQHPAGGGSAGRRGSLANLIPGAGRRSSLPVKEHRKQLSPAWKVNGAFDFSDEAVSQLPASESGGGGVVGGVTSLDELFSRSSASSPKAPSVQMEGIAEEVSTAAAAAAAAAATAAEKSAGTSAAADATVTATEMAAREPSPLPYSRTTPVGPAALPAPAELADGAPERPQRTDPATAPPPPTKTTERAVPTTSGASSTSTSRPGSRPDTASRRQQQQSQQQSRRPQTVAPRRASVARPAAAAAAAVAASTRLKTAGPIQQQRLQQQQQQQKQQRQANRPATTATRTDSRQSLSQSQSTVQSRPPTAAAAAAAPSGDVLAEESRPDTAALPGREYTMVFDSDSESSSSSSASDEEVIYQQSGGIGGVGGVDDGDRGGEDAVPASDSQNNLNRPGAEKPLKEKLWREDTTDENASQDQSIIEEMTREIYRSSELDQIAGAASSEPGFSVHVHVHVHVSRNSSPNRQEQQQQAQQDQQLAQQQQPTQPAGHQRRSNIKMLQFEHDGAI